MKPVLCDPAWVARTRRVPVRRTLLGFALAWLENQLDVTGRDSKKMRSERPFVFTNL